MDGALPVSSDIARNKAYTAAALRMPTHKAGPLTQPGQDLYGLELTNGGKMVVFGGGFPLALNGTVVGAIGVSGGSVDEDMTVAGAAVDAFEQMIEAARILGDILPEDLKTGRWGTGSSWSERSEPPPWPAESAPPFLKGRFT